MVARARIQRVGSGLLGSPRRFTAVRHKLLSAGARLSASVDRAKLPLRESRQIGADYFRRLKSGELDPCRASRSKKSRKPRPLEDLATKPDDAAGPTEPSCLHGFLASLKRVTVKTSPMTEDADYATTRHYADQ